MGIHRNNKKPYSMWTKNSQFNNLTIIKESWPLRRLKDLIDRYLKGLTSVEVKGRRKFIRKKDHLVQDCMLLQRGVLRELQFSARCLLNGWALASQTKWTLYFNITPSHHTAHRNTLGKMWECLKRKSLI